MKELGARKKSKSRGRIENETSGTMAAERMSASISGGELPIPVRNRPGVVPVSLHTWEAGL